MRREFLDQVLFWNGRDLERKLGEFQTYYNAACCHASLDGRTPLTSAGGRTVTPADPSSVRWVSHCRDLVQLPFAHLTTNSRRTRAAALVRHFPFVECEGRSNRPTSQSLA